LGSGFAGASFFWIGSVVFFVAFKVALEVEFAVTEAFLASVVFLAIRESLVVFAVVFFWLVTVEFLVELAVRFFSDAIVAFMVELALVWVAAVALAVEFTVAFF
jgi:hypothetical protein